MKEVMSNETKNTLIDYVFVIVLFAVAMFFPFEAFLLWLGAKGKEWFERTHTGCDKQARMVKYM